MGNRNPGRYRKEGREAFHPDELPNDICPYAVNISSSCKTAWYEGWYEAKRAYESESKEQNQRETEFEEMSWDCPWNDEGYCQGVHDGKLHCEEGNCAILYVTKESQKCC